MDQNKLKSSFVLHWLKHLNFSNFFLDKSSQINPVSVKFFIFNM